jgi:hypothetical protein
MVKFRRLRAKAARFRSSAHVLALGVGVSLFALHASSGQERHSTAATEPLRFSVASHVASTCGSAFSPSVIRGETDARLRAVGITVSSVHTAQLAADVDCVAVGPSGRSSAIAVQQCLGYSELVSTPSRKSGITLATTWRKCQSFVCGNGRCEPPMRAVLNTLMNEFFTDFERSTKVYELAVRPAETPTQAPVVLQTITGHAAQSTAVSVPPAVAFYSLYILACLILLFYWQFRSSLTNLLHS